MVAWLSRSSSAQSIWSAACTRSPRWRARTSSNAPPSTWWSTSPWGRGGSSDERRSARRSANSSYQRWVEAYESRSTASATAIDSTSGSPGSGGRTGMVARVNAASRMRLDPVNRPETVSSGTTLAPRSAKNCR